MHSHPHDDDDEPSSTGFLPISLAVGLFVTGLFALGYVQCEPLVESVIEPRL